MALGNARRNDGGMRDAEFDQLVKDVLGNSPPRVWSLLVTMFGDLALSKNARLSGTCVNALTAAMGIKPEATRVALHRLRKEGWIESQRMGRQSRYGLTDRGRAETQSAHPRVYAPVVPDVSAYLVLDNPATPMLDTHRTQADDTVQIAPHCVVTTRSDVGTDDWALPISAQTPIPPWAADKLCPAAVQDASQTLAATLARITERPDLSTLGLLQKTVLRVAIVHEWRRLVLRVPQFPDTLFPHGWHGPACRSHVATLLDALPRPVLDDLEDHVAG